MQLFLGEHPPWDRAPQGAQHSIISHPHWKKPRCQREHPRAGRGWQQLKGGKGAPIKRYGEYERIFKDVREKER